MKKKYEPVKKQKSFHKVELDLKLLMDTHSQLVNGKKVETNIVNTLLLGGIVNILCQSEQLDDVFERVKVLETENVQTKFRLESLENWMLKLNEKTQEATEKIDTFDGSAQFKEQIEDIRKEFSSLKETIVTPEAAESTPTCLPKSKSCNKCGEKFAKNFELENHMVHFHGSDKTNACEICGKTFYLKWRMKKHRSSHEGPNKPCKYFEHGQVCPFDEVGCKFVHEEAETMRTDEDVIENNPCIYCDTTFPSQGDLIEHMGNDHMDLFQHRQQEDVLMTF